MSSIQSFDCPLPLRVGFRRMLGTVALVAALTGWGGAVQAQADAETEVARVRFREGVALYDQGEFEKARLAFVEAYALKPHPAVLLNLAQSELRGGRFADAATHLSEYLRQDPNTENRARATAAFVEARARSVELRVRVSVAGAQIFVDGIERGVSPLTQLLYLTPGSHAVGATRGGAKVTKVVTAGAGEHLVTEMELPISASTVEPESPPRESQRPLPDTTSPAITPANANAPSVGADAPGADSSGSKSPGLVTWVRERPLALGAVAAATVSLTASAVMGLLSRDRYQYAEAVRERILDQFSINADPATGEVLSTSSPCGADGLPGGNSELFQNNVVATRREVIAREYGVACDEFTEGRSAGKKYQTAAWLGLGVGVGLGAATLTAYLTRNRRADVGQPQAGPGWRSATLQPIISPTVQGFSMSVDF